MFSVVKLLFDKLSSLDLVILNEKLVINDFLFKLLIILRRFLKVNKLCERLMFDIFFR